MQAYPVIIPIETTSPPRCHDATFSDQMSEVGAILIFCALLPIVLVFMGCLIAAFFKIIEGLHDKLLKKIEQKEESRKLKEEK